MPGVQLGQSCTTAKPFHNHHSQNSALPCSSSPFLHAAKPTTTPSPSPSPSPVAAATAAASPSPAAAIAAAPAPIDGCTPLAGFSAGFEPNQWAPFGLKLQGSGKGFAMIPSSSDNAATGQSGATVTVTQPGSALWHVQLSSAPTRLTAGKFYTLRYSAKSSAASSMQVALVSDATWKVSNQARTVRICSLPGSETE